MIGVQSSNFQVVGHVSVLQLYSRCRTGFVQCQRIDQHPYELQHNEVYNIQFLVFK